MILIDMPVDRFGDRYPRRLRGFGALSADRRVSYTDGPPIRLMFHFAWDFLDPADRASLLPLGHMRDYVIARQLASQKREAIIGFLKSPRLHHTIEPPLDPFRTWFMAAALISFDFDYGDLIRWLDGEYTCNYRDFSTLLGAIDRVSTFPTRPGYPPVDYGRATRILMEGAPLHGIFSCPQQATLDRVRYDNHPPLSDAAASVREKFGKEEAKSLHLALPRFVTRFLPGLQISPISWVIRKGKGRIVIDCSTKLTPDDVGAVNDQIPRQGSAGNEDRCPAVHYGDAFKRSLVHLWNLRIDHPNEDILMHVDDIDAAFRRIVYHPDAAAAFAYVFMEFCMMPIGQTFGGRSSPSFWCIPAELRAHLADCLNYRDNPFPMEASMTIEPPPRLSDIKRFAPAVRDTQNQGIPAAFRDRLHNSMFVDDNLTAAVRSRAIESVRAAVGSGNDVFHNPVDTRRPYILQAEKWEDLLSFFVTYLGFEIDSRALSVTCPPAKVDEIRVICRSWLDSPEVRRTPVELARLLGLVRHTSIVLPRGLFCTFPLQHLLNDTLRANDFRSTDSARLRNFWRRRPIRIPSYIRPYLELLEQAALNPGDWTRPIGLMVPRDPTCVAYSDAAYSGMGGWSGDFRFMWRLTRDQLLEANFPMRDIDLDNDRAAASAAGHDTLHINVLEFVGVIINLWFCLFSLNESGTADGGHVLLLRADNTTAVSLFKTAARSRRPAVRNLCFICEALLAFSNAARLAQIICNHIPGIQNDEADGLSRPEKFATIRSVMDKYCHLRTCRGFLVPYELLCSLAKAISSERIEGGFVAEMIQVLQVEPVSFNPGANDGTCNGGYSRPSRSRKR